jgi:hypothetical protein
MGKLDAVFQVELLADAVAVSLDGFDAQVQSFGDVSGFHGRAAPAACSGAVLAA